MILRHGRELQLAPAAAVDFHVILAPTNIGFVRPALRFQSLENGRGEGQPIKRLLGPITHFVQRLAALTQGYGIQVVAGGGRGGQKCETPLVTRPTAHDRLKEEQSSHHWTRPPSRLLSW